MSAVPLIRVRDLRGGYAAGTDAIGGVDFEVASGAVVSVLGPNGGGKTTLFRALLGELPHRSGLVELAERVAYVPQTERARLDFPVSALDVALMGTYGEAQWYRRLSPELRARGLDALEQVGMADARDQRFGELSGGQRQRVLIARALSRGAHIMLLDEPLTGLDHPSSVRVLDLMSELSERGHALLVATHDIHQARETDLVLCLNRQQIAFGAPAEALTAATLERTYGGELITLPGGERAVVVQHHSH